MRLSVGMLEEVYVSAIEVLTGQKLGFLEKVIMPPKHSLGWEVQRRDSKKLRPLLLKYSLGEDSELSLIEEGDQAVTTRGS